MSGEELLKAMNRDAVWQFGSIGPGRPWAWEKPCGIRESPFCADRDKLIPLSAAKILWYKANKVTSHLFGNIFERDILVQGFLHRDSQKLAYTASLHDEKSHGALE